LSERIRAGTWPLSPYLTCEAQRNDSAARKISKPNGMIDDNKNAGVVVVADKGSDGVITGDEWIFEIVITGDTESSAINRTMIGVVLDIGAGALVHTRSTAEWVHTHPNEAETKRSLQRRWTVGR
jgi:hypothetical protein